MPIKDPAKRREYQRELMRKKRNQGLTDNSVSPVSPKVVSPKLDPGLTVRPVRAKAEMLDPVKPQPNFKAEQQILQLKQEILRLQELNQILKKDLAIWQKPCPLNHTTLTELFQQAKEQVKTSWTEIISQGGTPQCPNCHNSQRNHQLAINLLEKYWTKAKKGGTNHA